MTTENAFAFEHDSTFEPGEVAGNVRLGKFEAQYEELFAEVIEDGVITREERARLNRAADALGLDRTRLAHLEVALRAAYEARYQVRIHEVGRDPLAELNTPLHGPSAASDQEISSSAMGSHVAALQERISLLEAHIAELEQQLVKARAHAAVEVDVSDVGAATSATSASPEDDPSELLRRVRHEPRDVASLHRLFRIYKRADDLDRSWCVAHALGFLGAANEEEQASFDGYTMEGLIRPAYSLSQESWRRLLFHPDEEILTGEIFAIIVSAVLLGRVSALRRDKTLPALNPEQKQNPQVSTLQAVRCFHWSAAILGMMSPPLYAAPDFDGVAEMVPALPPVSRLGKKALSGRSPRELAFAAGRHLGWYREEHFVRWLVPSLGDLEDLFLSALLIANPNIPLGVERRQRVIPIAKAIEPILEPIQLDRLRGYFLRFVEEGGRTNLQRWATAADRTATRAGLLLCNDLQAAKTMLEIEDPATASERLDDLLVFLTSDRYNSLRKQLGIAIKSESDTASGSHHPPP